VQTPILVSVKVRRKLDPDPDHREAWETYRKALDVPKR
jgi:hypothetical protein